MLHTCGDPRPRPACAKARQGAADIQIIPDPSRLQNWFKGKSAGRPDIFRSNSRLPVHISHKPSQGLKDKQVPTGIFGMREEVHEPSTMQSCCQWLLNILRVFSSQACCCNHEKQIKKGSESFHLFSAPKQGATTYRWPPQNGPQPSWIKRDSDLSCRSLFTCSKEAHISYSSHSIFSVVGACLSPIFTGSLTRSWTQPYSFLVSACFNMFPRVPLANLSHFSKTMPWTFPIPKNGPKDLSPPDMQKTSRSRTVWSPWSSEWVPPWRPFHRSWIAASRSWAGRAPWSSEASSSA